MKSAAPTKSKRREPNMLTGPIFINLVLYTIPIILTGILQLLFNAADLIIVGRYCGDITVAAVGNAGSVTALLVNLFRGLGVGTGVSVARALGAKDDDAVHRTVHTALPTAFICGIFVTAIGIIFSEPLLNLMNTPESVLPLSALYLRIYFAGAVFMMLYNFSAAILNAVGDTKTPLVFLTISGVLNVALNLFFVTVLDMSVDGVAWATTISQGFSAVLVLIVLCRRKDACRLVFSKLRIYKAQLKTILYIGLPAGLQNILFSLSNVFIQSAINPFGDVLMSGNAAAANIEGFLYVILNSFMQSALNFIGQNAGASNYNRVKNIFWVCMGCAIAVGAVLTSSIYALAPVLLRVYTDSPEAIKYGTVRLAFVGLPYILCGMMEVTTGALRGMGAAIVPMLISVLGVCGLRIVWILTIFTLPRFHTPQCLYLSYPVSWTATFMLQALAFYIVFRRQSRQQEI